MSKPLRINGVRHTLVEKWLLLSPWEYPPLLSNVPGSDYTSEVFSYSHFGYDVHSSKSNGVTPNIISNQILCGKN